MGLIRSRTSSGVVRPPMLPATGHGILTVTDNGSGRPLITTINPHGLSSSGTITVVGTGLYDGTYSFAASEFSIPSPTTISLDKGTFTVATKGGYWV